MSVLGSPRLPLGSRDGKPRGRDRVRRQAAPGGHAPTCASPRRGREQQQQQRRRREQRRGRAAGRRGPSGGQVRWGSGARQAAWPGHISAGGPQRRASPRGADGGGAASPLRPGPAAPLRPAPGGRAPREAVPGARPARAPRPELEARERGGSGRFLGPSRSLFQPERVRVYLPDQGGQYRGGQHHEK